jgi:hypothetical protein
MNANKKQLFDDEEDHQGKSHSRNTLIKIRFLIMLISLPYYHIFDADRNV